MQNVSKFVFILMTPFVSSYTLICHYLNHITIININYLDSSKNMLLIKDDAICVFVEYMSTDFNFEILKTLSGISVTAPIRRSTPWAFIMKHFPFVPTIEMSTLFSFPSKNQINATGAVT